MVTPAAADAKDQPEYSLDGLKRLARFGQVQFMSSRITRHLSNLGLGIDDVCVRLCELQATDFHRSERYGDDARWHDVYLLPHPVASNPRERLYIKFRVSRDCVWIELCSFHPEGWI